MKLQDTRHEFYKSVSDYIKECMKGNKKNTIQLVEMYTGSGKTHGIRELVKEIGPRFIYLAPRHEVIMDSFMLKGVPYPHLQSRSRIMNGEPYCIKARKDDDLKALLLNGKIDVSFMCNACDYRKECDYWITREVVEYTDTSWYGVHAHINSYLGDHLDIRNDYDVIIIDENPFTSLFNTHELRSPNQVIDLEEIMMFNDIDVPSVENALKGIRMLFRGGNPRKYFKISAENKENLDSFIPTYYKSLASGKFMSMKRIPSTSFVRTLVKILKTQDDPVEIEKRIRRDSYKKTIKLMHYDNSIFEGINIPMIILDATANMKIWKKIVGNHVFEPIISEKWQYRNVVHFRGGGEFYKKSWDIRDKSLALKIIEYVSILSSHGVLITGHKKVVLDIKEEMEKRGVNNIHVKWHYGLTSDNKNWEDCDTIMVVSRPTLPVITKKMYSDLTGFTNDEIDYIFTESEIFQSIGRIRQPIEKTTPKLPKGKLVGKKVSRKRGEINVIIFPELNSCNPFSNQENILPMHYHRISPGAYLKILTKGYINILEYKKSLFRKIFSVPRLKSEARKMYNCYDFQTMMNHSLITGELQLEGGKYVWKETIT